MVPFYKHISKLLTGIIISSMILSPKVSFAEQKYNERSVDSYPVITYPKKDEATREFVIQVKDKTKFDDIQDLLPKEQVISSFENTTTISVEMESETEIQEILTENNLADSVSQIYEETEVYMHKVPNDPLYGLQWGLPKISMETAWDTVVSSTSVIVAVVDSGVTPNSDMYNVINGADLSSGTLFEDSYAGQYSYDGGNHGTAVAAGIAAQHNNIGIAGINPNVTIMGVKVFADGMGTASSTTIASGIIWAADHGADIINLSVGSDYDVYTLRNAIAYASSKGVLLVASSGNEGYATKISYPAAYPNVIAVGSTSSNDSVSYFSNKGAELDIVAPGQSIVLPSIDRGEGNYNYFSGTSFSSPAVAGVASLLLTAHPELSSTQIEEILKSTARDIGTQGWDSSSGYGIVDAYQALVAAEDYALVDNNSSFETALDILTNTYYENHLAPSGDTDYFRFNLKEEYEVTVTAHSPADLDLMMSIYNAEGLNIFFADAGSTGQNEVINTTLSKGTYYISIQDYHNNRSSDPYGLEVKLTDISPPLISVYSDISGKIDHEGLSMGETDILISDASDYRWKVLHNGADMGSLQSVDAEGNYEVSASDVHGNSSAFSFVLDEDGYVKVTFDTGTSAGAEDQLVYYGDTLEFPEVSKVNHNLIGWYTDSSLTDKWDEEFPVRKNMMLYAGWNERQMTGIEIREIPLKVQYYSEDVLDITGLVVYARYDDWSTENIDTSEIEVTGFDSKKLGEQVITLNYNGFSAKYFINVSQKFLEHIEIISLPTKQIYVTGQEIELDGLVVEGVYNNGTRERLNILKENVSGFKSDIPVDSQNITVNVEGKTALFTVNIIERRLTEVMLIHLPAKRSYVTGEEFDLTGLELSGKFNDDSTEVYPLNKVTVTGFDSRFSAEKQVVTIKADEWSFVITVDISSSAEINVLAGTNRYRTAIAISKASYNTSETAVLVQANNFPDALAAGPVAYMENAPILLTSSSVLTTATRDELTRLGVKRVIIMGGQSAISYAVEETLIVEGYTVERIQGSNRFGTAVEAAEKMGDRIGGRSKVILASGIQFADALAAGSYAAKHGYPIILTDGKRLNLVTSDYLTNGVVEEVVIVGGNMVVTDELEAHLRSIGLKVTRYSGRSRFETSGEIAKSFFTDAHQAVIANGMEFADALAAAPFAARINAPILLVNQNRISASINEYLPSSGIRNITVVGGEAAVAESVRNELKILID